MDREEGQAEGGEQGNHLLLEKEVGEDEQGEDGEAAEELHETEREGLGHPEALEEQAEGEGEADGLGGEAAELAGLFAEEAQAVAASLCQVLGDIQVAVLIIVELVQGGDDEDAEARAHEEDEQEQNPSPFRDGSEGLANLPPAEQGEVQDEEEDAEEGEEEDPAQDHLRGER